MYRGLLDLRTMDKIYIRGFGERILEVSIAAEV